MNLCIKNLTVRDNKVTLVNNISFSLDSSDSLSIIGPSGSGKTTLLKAIIGIGQRFSIRGQVMLNEQLIEQDGLPTLPLGDRRFGYIPQDLSLWPHLDVHATLARAAHFAHVRNQGRELSIEQLLHDCGLTELKDRKPASLSGGEKQRLALARALVGFPQLLILDEPFSGLDVVSKTHLIELINRLKKTFGFAMIFVSHDLAESLAMGNKIMIMDHGMQIWYGAQTKLAAESFAPHWNPFTSPLVTPPVVQISMRLS